MADMSHVHSPPARERLCCISSTFCSGKKRSWSELSLTMKVNCFYLIHLLSFFLLLSRVSILAARLSSRSLCNFHRYVSMQPVPQIVISKLLSLHSQFSFYHRIRHYTRPATRVGASEEVALVASSIDRSSLTGFSLTTDRDMRTNNTVMISPRPAEAAA